MGTDMKIIIAGVGGQGTLFAAKVLGMYANKTGIDCKMSEVHGMAQRGGSVITHVIFGDKVFSPLVAKGTADVLLSFEKLECLRYLDFVKQGGRVLCSNLMLAPMPVTLGDEFYPTGIEETAKKTDPGAVFVDAQGIGLNCGSKLVANTVMLGVLAGVLNLNISILAETVSECVGENMRAVNIAALKAGYALKPL